MNYHLPGFKLSMGMLSLTMLKFLDKIPYSVLLIFTVFMLLAPFEPMPHKEVTA